MKIQSGACWWQIVSFDKVGDEVSDASASVIILQSTQSAETMWIEDAKLEKEIDKQIYALMKSLMQCVIQCSRKHAEWRNIVDACAELGDGKLE